MDVEKSIEVLNDESSSWVSRRDAAESLRDAARDAIAALQRQAEAKDTDVRMAVQNALKDLQASPTPSAAPKTDISALEPRSMAELVRACEKPGRRDVHEEDEGFRVEVTLKSGRAQTVHVSSYQRKDGIKLIRVLSFCGLPDEEVYVWALRANAKLVASAVALVKHEDIEHLALTRTFLDGEVTKPEMHTAIKEIAHYADWLELKVTGKDDF